MKRTMLEYSKTILQKVSFDAKLFYKELKKALERLLPEEVAELKVWMESFVIDKPELKSSLTYIKA